MKSPFLSHFTPSLMSHQALEDIFVQRQSLAARLVEHIRDSTLTPAKHYSLLIGPRGIGKTHLIALTYYRVQEMEDLRDQLRIAWMREEEWGVTSFLDLLLRIFRALQSEYPREVPAERIEVLYSLSPEAAEHAAAELLKEYIGQRTLLLLIENMDDLFEGLGDKGQKRLRAFLQENALCTIVATAQRLFSGVSRQSSPFYGFFRIQHLQGLDIEEVTLLLTNIANLKSDQELASFIQTPTGRARIRAVHHLAGGNHRVYVIFSQFLNRESLDTLVHPFMNMLDELTPYYQARMAWLSQQQRKIVEFLCDRRGAVPVKEIAQRGFMTHQTASSQLQDLREKGYVNAEAVGRESYYELSEPLMRLCVEVKKNRGGPIQLFVDFLRLWYSRDELQERLMLIQPDAIIEREYVLQALKESETESEDPRVKACRKDFLRDWQDNPEAALKAAEELITIRGNAIDWFSQWQVLHRMKRHDLALEAINKAVEIEPDNTYPKYFQGLQLRIVNRAEEALAVFDSIIDVEPQRAVVWAERAAALNDLERHEEAFKASQKAFEIDPKDHRVLSHHSTTLLHLGRFQEALETLDKALLIDPQDEVSWLNKGNLLIQLKLYKAALEASNKAVEISPKNAFAWRNRSQALMNLNQDAEALSSCQRAIDLDESDTGSWVLLGTLLSMTERQEDALSAWQQAIKLAPEDGNIWAWQGEAFYAVGQYKEALHSFDQADKRGAELVAIGFLRAVTLLSLGQWKKGFNALEAELSRTSTEHPPSTSDTWKILLALASDEVDQPSLEEKHSRVLALYENYGALQVLGQAILQSVRMAMSPEVDAETSLAWSQLWQEAAGDRAELQLPLRLLDAAIRYRQSGDQRVLLELPIEERKLLQELMEEETAPK